MATPSLAMIASATKDGKVYSVLPANGDGDFTFSRGSNATRVNKDGLIETVTGDIPRLDYTDSSCPSLLLEPQSTNLIEYSEDFSQWSSSLITELPSSEISPKGSLSAYNLNSTDAYSSTLLPSISINSGSNYTFSFWVKNATDDGKLSVRLLAGSNDVRYIFDINNKTSNPFQSYTSGFVSSNIEEYDNGWYRCSLTVLSNGTTATINLYPKYIDKIEENSIDVFGAQLEELSYATSYIPTNGAIATRLADECSLDVSGLGLSEITEHFSDGTSNVITSIPSTYTVSTNTITKIIAE